MKFKFLKSSSSNIRILIHLIILIFSLPKSLADTDLKYFSKIKPKSPVSKHSQSISAHKLDPRANRPITKEGCQEEDQYYPDYENCGVYFKCYLTGKDVWVRETFYCPEGQSFFENSQSCRNVTCSEREPWPQNPSYLPCEEHSQYKKNHVPGDCNEFYICIWTGSYFTHKMGKCFTVFFDEYYQSCKYSEHCPQEDVPKPPDWPCGQTTKELNPHPEDCTKYYICHNCFKKSGSSEKCVDLYQCPTNQIFNQDSNSCIPGNCPVKLPEGWKCDGNNSLHVHPEDCTKYYKCFECKNSAGGKWCYYVFENCSSGQFFDDILKECVKADKCPQDLTPLPPTWNCSKDGEIRVHPEDCTMYYTCIKCSKPGGWCYELTKCPQGEFFDDILKECVKADKCPQDLTPLPPTWNCSKADEINVHPEDCTMYYTCMKCSKPGGWCYESTKCSQGEFFDDILKKCVKADKCPQDLKPLPPKWNCTKDGDINVHPEDCTMYYSCIKCTKPGGWCYETTKCPQGEFFDDILKKCMKADKCPQDLKPLPPGDKWNCTKEGEIKVHPEDCTMYYTCIKCSKPGGWCYESTKCPQGEFFDDILKKCMKADKCPQDLKPLPPKWNCTKDGEINVHPEDCSMYYKCIKCSKPGGWCYETTKCPQGEFFDDILKQCVKAAKCPQDLIPLPPGGKLNCTKDGEIKVYPEDCTMYYTCIKCSKPGGWCYESTKCPQGEFFDDIWKKCVKADKCPQDLTPLPPKWNCTKDGEMNVHPENCSRYYTCIKCSKPGGWCYELTNCSQGEFFDNSKKKCVKADKCPPTKPPGPKPIYECSTSSHVGLYYTDPFDCSCFFKCNEWNSKFFLKYSCCYYGYYFDPVTEYCAWGWCPHYYYRHYSYY